ncbi:hypothetical protein AXF42_Ash019626 [Apostasia shenzhenica]|uniref:Uncharacterized protein n=1 Tax=Apostasia shenzhenica TaxID=1088818 RepID=A0A2I0A3I3_9ASPA|nr:hypothetical protein AXF42_Ash019626 [Apostasia shenzhenica]
MNAPPPFKPSSFRAMPDPAIPSAAAHANLQYAASYRPCPYRAAQINQQINYFELQMTAPTANTLFDDAAAIN